MSKTETERDALLQDYLQASEEAHQAAYGDVINAGLEGDADHLRTRLRRALDWDARSSIICAEIREVLTAYEEGMRRGFQEKP